MRTDPIIILGMHRSGTSILAEILSDLGVRTGRFKGEHHESELYVRLNELMLRQVGVDWDNPSLINWRQLDNYDLLLSYFSNVASWFYRIMGFRKKGLWAIKDPRMCLLLPFYQDTYPDARFIVIIRNGSDVAHSLKVRSELRQRNSIKRFRRNYLYRLWTYRNLHFRFIKRHRLFADGIRVHDLNYGIKIWDKYNLAINTSIRDNEQLLKLRYEDLTRNPVSELERVCSFLKIKANSADLERVAKKLFAKDEKVLDKSISIESIQSLNKHGYHY